MIGRLRSESGQTLVYVLLFISAFSVMMPSVVSYASQGVLGGRSLAALLRDREAAEAGAEYALRRIKAGVADGTGNEGPHATTAPAVTIDGAVSTPAVTMQRRVMTGIEIVQLAPVPPPSPAPAPSITAPSCFGLFRVRITDGLGTELPYGAVWSVKTNLGVASTGIDQGGRFRPPAADTYTITAQLANLRASKIVTATCTAS